MPNNSTMGNGVNATPPEIKCKWCEEIIKEGDERHDSVDGIICDNCYVNNSITCDRCSNIVHVDDSSTDNNITLCNGCREDYFRCDGCDNLIPNTEDTFGNEGESYCENCWGDRSDSDRNEVDYRHFNVKEKKFCNEEKGDIITSARTFGVELEMVNENMKNLIGLSKDLDTSFGVSTDGSIRGTYGIEIQTPVLSGKVGEDTLKQVLTTCKKREFFTNGSCGLHVHLGGEDYLSSLKVQNYLTWKDFVNYFGTNHKNWASGRFSYLYFHSGKSANLELKDGKMTCLMRADLLREKAPNGSMLSNFMVGKASIDWGAPIDHPFNDEFTQYVKTDSKLVKAIDKKLKGISGVEMKNYNDAGWYLVTPEALNWNKKEQVEVMGYEGKIEKVSQKKWVCNLPDEKNLMVIEWGRIGYPEKLKSLLYFYSVLGDVFLAMLPKSRWNNQYCKKLSLGFSPTDIQRCHTQESIEKMWYKTEDVRNIAQRKNGKYDESRYYGLNLHSLFSGNKTIEIRFHSGTLEEKKVLCWIALHQLILDRITNSEIYLENFVQANEMLLLKDKVDFFIKVLKLPKHLENYVMARIAHFTKLGEEDALTLN